MKSTEQTVKEIMSAMNHRDMSIRMIIKFT